MKCWHCDTEIIWGGDHDTEDEEGYSMVTNLTCPNCCLLYTSPSPRDSDSSRMPSSA